MNAKRQGQLDALKDAIHQPPKSFDPGVNHCADVSWACPQELPRVPPEQNTVGQKHDDGKPRWDLLPYDAVAGVVDVLTHGSAKYGPENWRTVQRWDERYFAAAMRHLSAYRRGSFTDDDSGLPHLAHAACCVLFLLAKEGETR
jgi:hypothetical protein